MKVGQGISVTKEKLFTPKEVKTTDSSSFQKILLEKQTDSIKEHLDALLEEITKQGERLVRSRTLKDLHTYKQKIKTFLQEVVKNGLSLELSTSFSSMTSKERSLLIIKEIDTNLLELSEEILEKESNNISLLDKMGEIRGLLLDLYL